MTVARIAAAAAMSLALAGCEMYGGGPLEENSPGVIRSTTLSPAQAQSLVHPGTSTRADVSAALGRANVIAFDSGWQVWVYRWPGADRSTQSATELDILFDPAGIVKKQRVRLPSPQR